MGMGMGVPCAWDFLFADCRWFYLRKNLGKKDCHVPDNAYWYGNLTYNYKHSNYRRWLWCMPEFWIYPYLRLSECSSWAYFESFI